MQAAAAAKRTSCLKRLTLQAKAAGVTMVVSEPKLSTVMYSVPLISSVMMVRLVPASIVGRTMLSVKLLSLCTQNQKSACSHGRGRQACSSKSWN